jgi:hypothetical protein
MENVYMVENEPYYDFFIKNNYKYLSHGYMHVIFEKDNYVYKIVKSAFKKFDKKDNYLLEAKALIILRENELPVANVINVYDKGEFIADFCVLKERKVDGFVKDKNLISDKEMFEIHRIIKSSTNILLNSYGPMTIDDSGIYSSWPEYLQSLFLRAENAISKYKLKMDITGVKNYLLNDYNYNSGPRYLILDPNEKNFVFNEDGNVEGIIDIDHPLGGDPLYQIAVFKYFRPQLYDFMINHDEISKDELKIIDYYAIIFSLNDIMFRSENDSKMTEKEISYYMNKIQSLYDESL